MKKIKWTYLNQEWSVNAWTEQEESEFTQLLSKWRQPEEPKTKEQEYLFVKVVFERRRTAQRYSYVAPTMLELKPWTPVQVEVLCEDGEIRQEAAWAVSAEMKPVSELRRIAAPFGGKLRKVVSK